MVQVTARGVTIGLEQPLLLLALPVALLVIGWLVLRKRSDAGMSRGSRVGLLALRLVVVTCLVVAAAGPYTVSVETVTGNPRVTLLVDDSESMAVFDADVDGLVAALEDTGLPVRRVVVGSGNRSRVGDGVVDNVEADGSVLLVSDGRVTGGRSLEAAAEFARSANATISAIDLSTTVTERFVSVVGPEKTTAGVENTFLVSVNGINAEEPVSVTVSIDGTGVVSRSVDGTGSFEFTRTFEATGDHRITARIETDDRTRSNDVFYRTIRVVDRPEILYVARGEYPFRGLLEELYDVTATSEVPADLSPYAAVVVQDVAADDMGDVTALRGFVEDGNGLVVVGGENAYENGAYATSPLATLLPVRTGEASSGGATVVLTIDVSGSTGRAMPVQKALALDVLAQLSPDDRVGVVAFDTRAYLVTRPVSLGTERAFLEDRIRRLQSGGGTRIAAGLSGAGTVLGEESGNVILISDGIAGGGDAIEAARRLGADGIRVITVGTGSRIDESLLRTLAAESGGTYLRASETSRLQVLFGDRARPTGGPLAVIDPSHFITVGVNPTAAPSESHEVTIKDGADFLVAAATGAPAIAAWRFGLGRVTSITAYGSDGTLDGLLDRPDSILLSRTVNWAIGDPERVATGVVALSDGRVDEPTRAVYAGPSRPTAPDVSFSRVAEGRYEATIVPTTAGFDTLLGRTYAVNYPPEAAGYGLSPAIERAVTTSGGRTFGVGEARTIARFVRRQSSELSERREPRGWLVLVVALLVYLVDVALRRLQLLGASQPTGR